MAKKQNHTYKFKYKVLRNTNIIGLIFKLEYKVLGDTNTLCINIQT
jgi:hypothetical protein